MRPLRLESFHFFPPFLSSCLGSRVLMYPINISFFSACFLLFSTSFYWKLIDQATQSRTLSIDVIFSPLSVSHFTHDHFSSWHRLVIDSERHHRNLPKFSFFFLLSFCVFFSSSSCDHNAKDFDYPITFNWGTFVACSRSGLWIQVKCCLEVSLRAHKFRYLLSILFTSLINCENSPASDADTRKYGKRVSFQLEGKSSFIHFLLCIVYSGVSFEW